MLWLNNESQTASAVSTLQANLQNTGGGEILAGPALDLLFGTTAANTRRPDIIVAPNVGVVYTGHKAKVSEHGGFANDDTRVMLLLSNPAMASKVVETPVQTAQVAPTPAPRSRRAGAPACRHRRRRSRRFPRWPPRGLRERHAGDPGTSREGLGGRGAGEVGGLGRDPERVEQRRHRCRVGDGHDRLAAAVQEGV